MKQNINFFLNFNFLTTYTLLYIRYTIVGTILCNVHLWIVFTLNSEVLRGNYFLGRKTIYGKTYNKTTWFIFFHNIVISLLAIFPRVFMSLTYYYYNNVTVTYVRIDNDMPSVTCVFPVDMLKNLNGSVRKRKKKYIMKKEIYRVKI